MDKHGDFSKDDHDHDNNGNESYVPFNVEVRDFKEDRVPSVVDNTSEVSGANVLKTLFFICVWYTFSLFLTL